MVHIAGHLEALGSGKTVTDELLQSLLQLGISGIAQRRGEAYDGGFGNAYVFAQTGCGHKYYLVIMGNYALSDTAVALGKFFTAVVKSLNKFLCILHWV
jgi:hypothetical protein